MSDSLAHYSFLPWLRQGIGTKITEVDKQGATPGGGDADVRASLAVKLTLDATDVEDETIDTIHVSKTLKMLGPPDVLAISKDAVVRNEPQAKVNNYESNGLPYIEFYEEDFLWRYTPARAGTVGEEVGRLTPWLALICLKTDEFEIKNTSDGRNYITISEDAMSNAFHDPLYHWCWGHVHMNTELVAETINTQITEVTDELEADPDSGVSRLLCPRKLIKETGYTAFLIPAFETGRLSGLSQDYSTVKAQEMSWGQADYSAKTRGYDYPVYHLWSFTTGLHGDFESLARILKPVVTDPELGKRDMYIAEAGYGLDETAPDSQVLGLEGALKPTNFIPDTWTNGSNDTDYREHLRKLLNLSIDHSKQQTDVNAADTLITNPFYSATLGDDPMVTPHVYGRWHGLVNRLDTLSGNHDWVDELNLDPRNRASAGLGVTVVQGGQEDFMRRAWKQVEEIKAANIKIRKAAVSKFVNMALHAKHIQHASADKTLRQTAPMHKFSVQDGQTIEHKITNSLVPNAAKSAGFTKVTRPGKKNIKLVNKQVLDLDAGATLPHHSVIPNFNNEIVRASIDKTVHVLPSVINTGDVSLAISSSVDAFTANKEAMAQHFVFETFLGLSSYTNLETGPNKTLMLNDLSTLITDYTGTIPTGTQALAQNLINAINASVDGGAGGSHEIKINDAPFVAIFAHTPATADITTKSYQNILISREVPPLQTGRLSNATGLNDLTLYSDTFSSFTTDTSYLPIPKGNSLGTTIEVTALSDNLTAALQPAALITKRLKSSVSVMKHTGNGIFTKDTNNTNLDKLRPVMAYPKFDDPMFRDLKKLSQEYILPNIEMVPENSITLLETNQAFIEAYMSGLNHEMSRELLWREYPTDQRGTYFRQFWDIADNVTESDQELKYDIKPMHQWNGSLGEHTSRVKKDPEDDSSYLVLVVRGELLKKYPNTQVYAQKAAYDGFSSAPGADNTPRVLDETDPENNILFPVFMAELEPDIYLFGFDLDDEEAKGDSTDETQPGWYFILRERPGQIRFGLDDYTPVNPDDAAWPVDGELDDWNDLSWEHLVNDASDLGEYQMNAAGNVLDEAISDGGITNTPLATWGNNSADMAYILYQNPVLFARHGQEMLPD